MRIVFCIFLSCFFNQGIRAQQDHFIYLQTENRQSFYIKVNDNFLSSSASGYLIIPKLKAGMHNLTIGFPKNEWPAEQLTVTIADKDEGFLLKNFDQKGWGLFNLRTMDVVMGQKSNVGTDLPATEMRTDAFSNILAEVTNTASVKLREKPVLISPAVADTIGSKKDKALQTNMTVADTVIQAPGVSNTASDLVKEEVQKVNTLIAAPMKDVNRVFTFLDSTGRTMIYASGSAEGSDTIRLFIPYEREVTVAGISTSAPIRQQDSIKLPEVSKALETAADLPGKSIVPDQSNNPPVQNSLIKDIIVTDGNPSEAGAKITLLNAACTANATDGDFFKLRKKMASAGADDDMVAAARKVFRSKCFTTGQIKNLGTLFLKDEGKYKFYDAAYRHVSDPDHFKNLQAQLSEEYYITRFKAMLH